MAYVCKDELSKAVDTVTSGEFTTFEEVVVYLNNLQLPEPCTPQSVVDAIRNRFILTNDTQKLALAVKIHVFDGATDETITTLFIRAASYNLQHSMAFLCEIFSAHINQPAQNRKKLTTHALPIALALRENLEAARVLFQYGARLSMIEYLRERSSNTIFLSADSLQLFTSYKGMTGIDIVTSKFDTPLQASIAARECDSIRLLSALGCTQHARKKYHIPQTITLPNEEETLTIRYQCFFQMSACHRLLVVLEELKLNRLDQTQKIIDLT